MNNKELAKTNQSFNPLNHKLFVGENKKICEKTIFKTKWFVTFNQAKDNGFNIKKGSHGIKLYDANGVTMRTYFNIELLEIKKDGVNRTATIDDFNPFIKQRCNVKRAIKQEKEKPSSDPLAKNKIQLEDLQNKIIELELQIIKLQTEIKENKSSMKSSKGLLAKTPRQSDLFTNINA